MTDNELKRAILMNILSTVTPAFKRVLFDRKNEFLAFSVSPIFRLTGTTDVKWFDETYVRQRNKSVDSWNVSKQNAQMEAAAIAKRSRNSILAESLSVLFDSNDDTNYDVKSDVVKTFNDKNLNSSAKRSIFVSIKKCSSGGKISLPFDDETTEVLNKNRIPRNISVEVNAEIQINPLHVSSEPTDNNTDEEDSVMKYLDEVEAGRKRLDDYLDLWC
eukprot:g3538.t1